MAGLDFILRATPCGSKPSQGREPHARNRDTSKGARLVKVPQNAVLKQALNEEARHYSLHDPSGTLLADVPPRRGHHLAQPGFRSNISAAARRAGVSGGLRRVARARFAQVPEYLKKVRQFLASTLLEPTNPPSAGAGAHHEEDH
jgi:hypothetical protein